jgi:alpha-1,2-mannosyltransferase
MEGWGIIAAPRAPVAQWIERRPPEPKVAGSNPVRRATSPAANGAEVARQRHAQVSQPSPPAQPLLTGAIGMVADARKSANPVGFTRRRTVLTLLIIGGAGVALRGFLRQGVGLGFDEGVYYSAAGSWVAGFVPYIGFTYLHPPGGLILLWPAAFAGEHLAGHAAGFLLAKATVALAVLLVIAGIGWLAYKWEGPIAACLAASLYASFQPGVLYELPIRLEPFVNVAFVGAAAIWLSGPNVARIDRRLIASAVLAGAALATKLTGGVILIGLLASRPFERQIAGRIVILSTALLVTIVLVAPFAISNANAFLEQVLRTQLARPGGDVGGSDITDPVTRLLHMLQIGPSFGLSQRAPGLAAVALVAIHGLAAGWAWIRGGPQGRFWAATWGVALLMLLIAPSYYTQYPLLLAVPGSVLLGWAFSRAITAMRLRPSSVALALAGVIIILSAPLVALASRELRRQPLDTQAAIRQLVPPGQCFYADPATLGIAAGRLPPADVNGPLVDPFGELLRIALRDGNHYPSAEAALASGAAQQRLRDAISACRFVASIYALDSGPRLEPSTRAWFQRNFERVAEPIFGVGVWQRRVLGPDT